MREAVFLGLSVFIIKIHPSIAARVYLFVQLVTTATASAVVVTATIVETTAEEKDYDENDNPRRTAATVIASATH